MIPVSLRLQNFMSYGESAPTLDFTRFRLACLSGPNGHGKSSLLDAITWALWGQARKAPGSTKPDEGLLRIGARRMQVEFVFDLPEGKAGRYRVIRSFEQRPSGRNKPDLAFEMADPEQDRFLSLSHSSLKQTQQLIEAVLRMDYDTFINSSFLLQGRADEFTRKKPRERKVILGEILGLSRYEKLQQLARETSREMEKSLVESRVRCEAIDRELEQSAVLEKENAEVGLRLAQVEQQSIELEKAIERHQEKRREAELLQAGIESARKNLKHLAVVVQEAKRQLGKYRVQREKFGELLGRQEEIGNCYRLFVRLQEESKTMQKALEEKHRLEKEIDREERRIEASRHQLENQLTRLTGRAEALEDQIRQTDVLVGRKAEAEAEVEKLERTRAGLLELEEKEKQVNLIDREREQYLRQIESEKAALLSRIRGIQEQISDYRKRSDRMEALKAELSEVARQEKEYEKLENHLDAVRDKGQERRSALDAVNERIDQAVRQMDRDRQDLTRIRETKDVRCPLCESELNETHQLEVIGKIEGRMEETKQRLLEWEKEKASLEEQVGRLRKEYQEGQKGLIGRGKVREARGRIHSELSAAESSREMVKQLEERSRDLQDQLDREQFAEPARKSLEMADAKKESIGFSSERIQDLRREIEKRSTFPDLLKTIFETEKQRREWKNELDRKIKERETIQNTLQERLFEEAARRRLVELREQVRQLNEELSKRQQVQAQLEDLKEAPILKSKLDEARTEAPTLEKEMLSLENRLDDRMAEEETMKQVLADNEGKLAGMESVEEHLQKAVQTRKEVLAERDRLQSVSGGLRQQLEQLDRMKTERRDVGKRRKHLTEEKSLYDALVEAFGPNGVPALIIENAVPEIQNEANRILERLTGGRTRIAIESQREKKTGGAIETLDIRIGDEMGTRPYEMYSGGEAFRTDLAIRIALSRLLARRAGTRLQTLVIDEGFGTQDVEGLEAIVEVIRQIASEFEKILVVTHLDALKNAFPARIEVTKKAESGSTFEVFS